MRRARLVLHSGRCDWELEFADPRKAEIALETPQGEVAEPLDAVPTADLDALVARVAELEAALDQMVMMCRNDCDLGADRYCGVCGIARKALGRTGA